MIMILQTVRKTSYTTGPGSGGRRKRQIRPPESMCPDMEAETDSENGAGNGPNAPKAVMNDDYKDKCIAKLEANDEMLSGFMANERKGIENEQKRIENEQKRIENEQKMAGVYVGIACQLLEKGDTKAAQVFADRGAEYLGNVNRVS